MRRKTDRPLSLPPEPTPGDYPATTVEQLVTLAFAFARCPVPTPFELVRVADPTGISGTGRVAHGLIFPGAGGAVYQWHQASPPFGWPATVRQFGVFDSIAEVLAVHGHQGATILRTYDATDQDGRRLDSEARADPEAFAVVDNAGDVPEWGVWLPERDQAVTWAPPVTPISGRQQADRITRWHSMAELTERMAARTGISHGRVVWLTSNRGRKLITDVRGAHLADLGHTRRAAEAALASLPPFHDELLLAAGLLPA